MLWKLSMEKLIDQINKISTDIEHAYAQVTEIAQLEQIRNKFLSRQGIIAQLTDQFKQCSQEEKRTLGPVLQALKTMANERYEQLKQQLASQAPITTQEQLFDVTAYKYKPMRGGLHIYTRFIEQVETIFTTMGYAIVDGPEVETEYYNFEALNIPADHPARDMQDTFWLYQPGMLLRTHTSSVQTHILEQRKLPLAICAPGRVYRNEQTDASHEFMFMQTEGLFIDKHVSVAHLLATVRTFLQALFDSKAIEIRARPGYFPFVEPGIEIDASCPFCKHGCSTCKHTGWIELMGSGLVHPAVLQASGIDPKEYRGFAFGFGIERIAMIKHGIHDIRLFHSTKLPILKQWQ